MPVLDGRVLLKQHACDAPGGRVCGKIMPPLAMLGLDGELTAEVAACALEELDGPAQTA